MSYTYDKEFKRRLWLGGSVAVLGMIGSFTLMSVLNLFGSKIEYTLPYLLKSLVAFLPLLIGLAGAGYIYGGLRAAYWWFASWAILLMTANLIGYLGRDIPQEIRNTFPLIFFVALVIGVYLWNKWVDRKSH